MNRIIEILLGLDRGFLGREGDFSLNFNPRWPLADSIGNASWNLVLGLAIVVLVVVVYRREGRKKSVRVGLAGLRLALLAFVLLLLNRPVLSLTQSRIEPSVLAVMIDDSLSMRVKDINLGREGANGATTNPADAITRLAAADQLLTGENAKLINDLAKIHQLRFYRFNSDALPVLAEANDGKAVTPGTGAIEQQLAALEPLGQTTQVARSVRTVLQDLQGVRLAGVVVLTDGRDTPQPALAATIDAVKDFGVGVYPIPVGTDAPLRNVEVQTVSVQDAVFAKDIVNVKVGVRATGASVGQPVTLRLKDKATQQVILGPDGRPVEKTFTPTGDTAQEQELQFTPAAVGNLDLVVEAEPQPGEVDDQDNRREVQLAVLDAKINVLYVDGYPRWEYRYLKTEMIRDKTVSISCLLTSADASFRQEGDKPITRFPETLSELLEYDVIVFGDVDPREFTDGQLQLVSEFVSRRGGGFGMISGPRFSPQAWKGSPIEAVLPVDITRVETFSPGGSSIAEGFRPVLTRDGGDSGIFRFFPDREINERYLKESLQPIFWYARGATVKPGVGEVYAEHPADVGPDGRKAPILVVGRFGAGRTLFSAIDDSWRWRYYTGESVFNTYWVQQLRYLARSRKLGQRKATLVAGRPVYDLGEQASVTLRIIDPQLQTQLPDQLRVQVTDEAGNAVRQETLVKQEGQGDVYVSSFTASSVGKFRVTLPSLAPGVEDLTVPLEIAVPKLELQTPQADRGSLARLASETSGQVVPYDQARATLAGLIPSAERQIPLLTARPLWDAPLALVLFVLLLTTEWVGRKMFGMV